MHRDNYKAKLDASQYKLTGQRATVLEVMIRNRGKHLSAEEVLQQARLLRPNIGIATVYRTLEKLASLEICTKACLTGQVRSIGDAVHHVPIGSRNYAELMRLRTIFCVNWKKY